jgi:AbrB family looped-hinge helix DNA binding protein
MTNQMVRVQEKGQVTIPLAIRQRLKLKKGDLVTFVETEDGVLIVPVEIVTSQALDQIGEALKQRGLVLDDLIEQGRDIRSDLIKDEYDLPEPPET